MLIIYQRSREFKALPHISVPRTSFLSMYFLFLFCPKSSTLFLPPFHWCNFVSPLLALSSSIRFPLCVFSPLNACISLKELLPGVFCATTLCLRHFQEILQFPFSVTTHGITVLPRLICYQEAWARWVFFYISPDHTIPSLLLPWWASRFVLYYVRLFFLTNDAPVFFFSIHDMLFGLKARSIKAKWFIMLVCPLKKFSFFTMTWWQMLCFSICHYFSPLLSLRPPMPHFIVTNIIVGDTAKGTEVFSFKDWDWFRLSCRTPCISFCSFFFSVRRAASTASVQHDTHDNMLDFSTEDQCYMTLFDMLPVALSSRVSWQRITSCVALWQRGKWAALWLYTPRVHIWFTPAHLSACCQSGRGMTYHPLWWKENMHVPSCKSWWWMT